MRIEFLGGSTSIVPPKMISFTETGDYTFAKADYSDYNNYDVIAIGALGGSGGHYYVEAYSLDGWSSGELGVGGDGGGGGIQRVRGYISDLDDSIDIHVGAPGDPGANHFDVDGAADNGIDGEASYFGTICQASGGKGGQGGLGLEYIPTGGVYAAGGAGGDGGIGATRDAGGGGKGAVIVWWDGSTDPPIPAGQYPVFPADYGVSPIPRALDAPRASDGIWLPTGTDGVSGVGQGGGGGAGSKSSNVSGGGDNSLNQLQYVNASGSGASAQDPDNLYGLIANPPQKLTEGGLAIGDYDIRGSKWNFWDGYDPNAPVTPGQGTGARATPLTTFDTPYGTGDRTIYSALGAVFVFLS